METLKLPELTTITSEVVLSLYPILIKVVDTGLESQLLARLATFTTLAAVLVYGFDITKLYANPLSVLFLGFLNLVHIGTSYQAFKDLPAGPAMALFYTFPFMNLLLAWFILGEQIKLSTLPWFFLAFLGSLLVVRSLKSEESFEQSDKGKSNTTRGVYSAISAALTESIIFIVTKNIRSESPFPLMTHLYGGGLILFVLGLILMGKPVVSDFKTTTWVPLIAFNALIGFIGYALRFWSIPRLSSTIFSILSFVGVFSAFAFGARFVGEIPSLESLTGGALIATSIAAVRSNFSL